MAKKSKFDYFDEFQKLSDLAVQESDLLIHTIENFQEASMLGDVLQTVHEIEHKGDLINHNIYQQVATDFMPPIDREDILELAQRMDDVLDLIESVIQRFYMCDIQEMHKDAASFAKLIKKGTKALDKAMEDFRNFKRSKKFKSLIVDVNTYEEEGDAMLINVMRSLYIDDKDRPMFVLVWSQIFNYMERCCDSCEHVADVMSTVLLKNV